MKKGGENREKAVEVMSRKLEEHWKDSVNYIWDCCLDKFICDYEMR